MVRPARVAASMAGWILLAGMSVSASAACKAPQSPVFSCELAKQGGQIELCAAGSRSKLAFPLTLTHSKDAKTLLQFSQRSLPATPGADAPQFLYAFYGRYQVSRVELRAPRPAARGGDVVLYSHFENDGSRPETGLRVAGQDLACRRVTLNRLATLEALLTCDPDNELGINACPEGK